MVNMLKNKQDKLILHMSKYLYFAKNMAKKMEQAFVLRHYQVLNIFQIHAHFSQSRLSSATKIFLIRVSQDVSSI